MVGLRLLDPPLFTRIPAGRDQLVCVGVEISGGQLEHLREMGDLVGPMVRTAMDAFVQRDLGLALRLPEMDEPVNRLNRSMAREIANCAQDHSLLEWAVPMLMVARALERVGDQAVDIAEQVAFLLTGEFQEFSRPDVDNDH